MRSLVFKLVLAFFAVSLIGIAFMAVLAGRVTAREFGTFLNSQNQESIVAQLGEHYRHSGGWGGVENIFPGRNIPPSIGTARSFALVNPQGFVLIPTSRYPLGQHLSANELEQGVLVLVDDQVVGILIPSPAKFSLSRFRAQTLKRINNALFLGVLGATGTSLVLGVILARTLTHTLRELKDATKAVARGDLTHRVPIRTQDELGELADSFNQMSDELVRSRDLRRQMTADIAHELRTPLSVILGHAEAMNEGVLEPSPETMDIIHDEAKTLSRLVEDLRTLSLSEAGELLLACRLVAPGELLARVATAYQPEAKQKNIDLHVETGDDLPDINIDPDRMIQVLGNLLDNALRYTPEGGQIKLSARYAGEGVELSVQDSGPGIAPEELSHIFDRFFRGDKSRQRDEGGSGLGLAIAKSIVERHNGCIWAESDLGEGVTMVIRLSIQPMSD